MGVATAAVIGKEFCCTASITAGAPSTALTPVPVTVSDSVVVDSSVEAVTTDDVIKFACGGGGEITRVISIDAVFGVAETWTAFDGVVVVVLVRTSSGDAGQRTLGPAVDQTSARPRRRRSVRAACCCSLAVTALLAVVGAQPAGCETSVIERKRERL